MSRCHSLWPATGTDLGRIDAGDAFWRSCSAPAGIGAPCYRRRSLLELEVVSSRSRRGHDLDHQIGGLQIAVFVVDMRSPLSVRKAVLRIDFFDVHDQDTVASGRGAFLPIGGQSIRPIRFDFGGGFFVVETSFFGAIVHDAGARRERLAIYDYLADHRHEVAAGIATSSHQSDTNADANNKETWPVEQCVET